MNHRIGRLASAALIGSAAFLAGCYTLLRHPTTEDGYEHADFSECTSCHEIYSHFTPYDPLYPDRWWDYYAVPWWYGEVVVIDEEGDAPADRAIRAREMHLRDGSDARGPVLIKRRPFSGAVDASPSGPQPADSGAGERPADEPKTKESPSKRTTKRGEEDGGGRVRERSADEGSSADNDSSTAGENRSKKRKEP